jgi:outer membrane receptor protein involved in Fe transport
VNYGFVSAEWKEYEVETADRPIDYSGKAPTGVPRHVFSAGIEQGVGLGFLARAWWESYADYFITQDNERSGGGYGLLNASLSWRPARGKVAGVTLTATNLLDEEYYYLFGGRSAVYDAVPGVPFQARLTVDLRF